ncbi:MAG: cache domain-containing protein [Desulfobacterales bacterium]|nr:cache domain-containing protein [Desulfobacterales bacterium]
MDLPLRVRLLGAFVGVVVLSGALTILAGSFLIKRMVISEAERRVVLGLKTARAMWERRLDEALKACLVISEGDISEKLSSHQAVDTHTLDGLRIKLEYDFLHILDSRGTILTTASGDNLGAQASISPVISCVLQTRKSAAGISILPLETLTIKNDALAARTKIPVLSTPHAKPGGPREITSAMVLEAAAPILDDHQELTGIVRVGTVINQNFDFVDFVRENVFTAATYGGKNMGTVTIFQGDVRITTNVVGPDGKRAIGTRVSAEVYDKVLNEGHMWTGPAFVVDSWYISAYEPLRNLNEEIVGMLYVGVLKKRYDDMRRQAMTLFSVVAVLVFLCAVSLSLWLSARQARPITQLTVGADEVARGNLNYQLSYSTEAKRDEIYRLTSAFNQMVSSLKERDRQLQHSRDDLQQTATELKEWVQNYLDALEFITHELKNQIAAMKINLLAVHDGYIGNVSAEQKEALNDVVTAINRAEEMTLNYLNLSRIEKGELQVRARPVHLESDVIRPVLSNFRGRLEATGMRVEVDFPEDLFVQADPALLEIVYENLLGNATRYGRDGGVIKLWGKRLGDKAELHVWNDGPGVPADQIDRLFRKFSRLQTAAKVQPGRGTGLGLFITREIIRRHGGAIHAQSRYHEWLDIIFELPLPDVLIEEPADNIEVQPNMPTRVV